MVQQSVRAVHEQIRYIHNLFQQLKMLANRWHTAQQKVAVHERKIREAEAEYESIKNKHTAMLLKAKEAEHRFNQSDEALKRRKSQLMEAKNNKEYKSLADQIAGDQVKNDALAEDALLLAEEAEGFLSHIEDAQKKIDAAKADFETVKKELDDFRPVVKKSSEQIKSNLQTQISNVHRDYTGYIHRAIETFGGDDGLAPVEGDDEYFCGSCHLQISINHIVDMCGGQPYVCGSCGRLLYFPKDFHIHND